MKTINISDVRNNLPSVIEGVVQTNEVVVVTRYGKPIVSIVPFRDRENRKALYPLRGKPIKVASDFDEPMPEIWDVVNE